MVEHVRARLARQICAQNTSMNGYLPLIALSAKWEQAFAESLIGQGEERSLAMQPSKLSEFMTVVRERFEQAAREGEAPVLVTSAAIRPFVRSLVERGELELHGWVYDIASGGVRGLDASGRLFVPLEGDAKPSPRGRDTRDVLASVETDEKFWEKL